MSLSKKRSAVWEFFKQVDNEGKQRVVCELCKASLAYCGGTTSMKTHLTHKQPSMDRSIGHAHFLVYGILVVSMSGLV